jgi:hypothetical protein
MSLGGSLNEHGSILQVPRKSFELVSSGQGGGLDDGRI